MGGTWSVQLRISRTFGGHQTGSLSRNRNTSVVLEALFWSSCLLFLILLLLMFLQLFRFFQLLLFMFLVL